MSVVPIPDDIPSEWADRYQKQHGCSTWTAILAYLDHRQLVDQAPAVRPARVSRQRWCRTCRVTFDVYLGDKEICPACGSAPVELPPAVVVLADPALVCHHHRLTLVCYECQQQVATQGVFPVEPLLELVQVQRYCVYCGGGAVAVEANHDSDEHAEWKRLQTASPAPVAAPQSTVWPHDPPLVPLTGELKKQWEAATKPPDPSACYCSEYLSSGTPCRPGSCPNVPKAPPVPSLMEDFRKIKWGGMDPKSTFHETEVEAAYYRVGHALLERPQLQARIEELTVGREQLLAEVKELERLRAWSDALSKALCVGTRVMLAERGAPRRHEMTGVIMSGHLKEAGSIWVEWSNGARSNYSAEELEWLPPMPLG